MVWWKHHSSPRSSQEHHRHRWCLGRSHRTFLRWLLARCCQLRGQLLLGQEGSHHIVVRVVCLVLFFYCAVPIIYLVMKGPRSGKTLDMLVWSEISKLWQFGSVYHLYIYISIRKNLIFYMYIYILYMICLYHSASINSLNLDRVLSCGSVFVKRATRSFQTKVVDSIDSESFTVELSRQEDDVSSVLKGISTASLEALNYAGYLNEKYAPCWECNFVVRC